MKAAEEQTSFAPTGVANTGFVIGTIALALPPIAVFSALPSAAMLAGGAVLCAALRLSGRGAWVTLSPAGLWSLGLALAWAFASLAWTIEPLVAAAEKLLRLVGICIAGLVLLAAAGALSAPERALVRRLALIGILLALALFAVEFLMGAPLRRLAGPVSPYWPDVLKEYDRGISVLVLVLWPAFAMTLAQHGQRALLLFPLATGIVLMASSSSALFALAAGMVGAGAAWFAPRPVARLLASGMVAALLISPFAARLGPLPEDRPLHESGSFVNSIDHRLIIWRFAADRIAERPILGWGYNASRSIPGGDREIAPTAVLMPLHPHNAGLQWWLELGAIGVLLGSTVVLLPLWRVAGAVTSRGPAASCIGLAVSAFCIAELSFGIWQSWWLSTLFLAAVLMAVENAAIPGPAQQPSSVLR